MRGSHLVWTNLYILLVCTVGFSNTPPSNKTKLHIVEAGRIAKNIQHIHPNLSYNKALEYGRGILDASVKYGIDSNLLVSIAHQESGFRENLPEGKAGELGICQVRKMWVKNEKFQDEFGLMHERELMKPARSFMVAAWILSELKKSRKDGVVPYWSYYNAIKFHHRLRYYTLVNRYLSAIQNKKPVQPLRKVAAIWKPQPEYKALPMEAKRGSVIGAQNNAPVFEKANPYWRPVAQDTTQSGTPSSSGWIPSALRKLQSQSQRTGQPNNPALVKAAFDLNVPNIFGSLPVPD